MKTIEQLTRSAERYEAAAALITGVIVGALTAVLLISFI